MVPLAGLEPARMLLRGILSPLRLPIPPQRRKNELFNIFEKTLRGKRRVFMEAPPRFELGVKVLQTRALPLGYGAIREKPLIKKMERETRFELATFALARRRSTTEPFPHTYNAMASTLVGTIGLEPMTLCL